MPARWPVVERVATSDADGILKKSFITFDRPDGLERQTVDCRLLCPFGRGKAPGGINAQEADGTWYAVSRQGKLTGGPK